MEKNVLQLSRSNLWEGVAIALHKGETSLSISTVYVWKKKHIILQEDYTNVTPSNVSLIYLFTVYMLWPNPKCFIINGK